MSLQACPQYAYTGFPLLPPSTINTLLDGTTLPDTAIVPQDISIAFASYTGALYATVVLVNNTLQINLVNNEYTTLTYGPATYTLDQSISIVKNQHARLTGTKLAEYEMILTFYIRNKSAFLSSPDIILLCRPLFVTADVPLIVWTQLLNAASKPAASTTGQPTSADLNISSFYSFDGTTTLMPAVAYSTCIPVKLSSGDILRTSVTGSISTRVYVINQPININDTNGLLASSNLGTYSLPGDIPNLLFPQHTTLQCKDYIGPEGFPSDTNKNLVLKPASPSPITTSDATTLLGAYEYVVSDDLLGMSIRDIAALTTDTPGTDATTVSDPTANTKFKCYKINPTKDIKKTESGSSTIIIDPKTGLPLDKMMAQRSYNENEWDPSLSINAEGSSGLMPGDWQHILFIVFTVCISISLLAYIFYIIHTFVYRRDTVTNSFVFSNVAVVIVLLAGLIGLGVAFGEKKI